MCARRSESRRFKVRGVGAAPWNFVRAQRCASVWLMVAVVVWCLHHRSACRYEDGDIERVQDAELQRILLETKASYDYPMASPILLGAEASHDYPKALTTCTGPLRC